MPSSNLSNDQDKPTRAGIAERLIMSYPVHSVTVNTLSDLEACCRRWREIGANDDTIVVLRDEVLRDEEVIGTLMEQQHGLFSISFSLFSE